MRLQYIVEDERIAHNSVKNRSWPRYDDKTNTFLKPEQVTQVFALDWEGTWGTMLWWFLLMCYTGLDYPNTKACAKNRASLERTGTADAKLSGRRLDRLTFPCSMRCTGYCQSIQTACRMTASTATPRTLSASWVSQRGALQSSLRVRRSGS